MAHSYDETQHSEGVLISDVEDHTKLLGVGQRLTLVYLFVSMR